MVYLVSTPSYSDIRHWDVQVDVDITGYQCKLGHTGAMQRYVYICGNDNIIIHNIILIKLTRCKLQNGILQVKDIIVELSIRTSPYIGLTHFFKWRKTTTKNHKN